MTENHEANPAVKTTTSPGGSGSASDSWANLLIGNPETKLDERGRLKLPAEYKSFIEEKYGQGFNAFYIASQDGVSADIYPMPAWLDHQAKILALPRNNEVRVWLQDRYALWGARADADPQGRMQLPARLLAEGELSGDVKVTGEGAFLRVTKLTKLETKVGSSKSPAEMAAALSDAGF